MTTCFAPAIGPTYGGFILHEFNWNQIFLFLRARLSPASFQFHSAVSVSALDLKICLECRK